MKIIVDTPVWSLALRRGSRPEDASVAALGDLIGDGLVVMLGCIRQEILSGVRSEGQFQILRDHSERFRTKSLKHGTMREQRNFSTIAGEKGFRVQTRIF